MASIFDGITSSVNTHAQAVDNTKPGFMNAVKSLWIEASTQVKSIISSPDAYSRISKSPIYFYNKSDTSLAGFTNPHGNSIYVDESKGRTDNSVGQTIKHESAHQIIEPVLSRVAKENPAAGSMGWISSLLSKDQDLYGKNPSQNSLYSEGMAYMAQGAVPRSDWSQARDFTNKTLDYIRQVDPSSADKYQRLSPYVSK